jgi:hypothetical protein
LIIMEIWMRGIRDEEREVSNEVGGLRYCQ